MRLKQLYLHGFKTFAPKTELLFGEGLTAIVGPNGSGKSNVADAVRWVLGEQSLSNLRAKRTEDLIFAGSSNRAPVGMAEVSITIDNSDRLLPLDFSEVTLTRRAYRSGENEYYVNKSRVRLRDVLDVASTLGQAYTVVGQGLVDAALSLRPEERRELFEEAAAIRGYFVQREDALKRLGKTEENVARVSDLASELEPQVRRMERQARQAHEYKKLEGELRGLLAVWYRRRWKMGVEGLLKAEEAEARARHDVEERKTAMTAKTAQLGAARAQVWQLVDSVSALHEQRAQVQARHAAGSQGQAVLGERLSATRSLRQSLLKEREALESSRADLERKVQELDVVAEEHKREAVTLEESSQATGRKLADIVGRLNEARGEHDREAAQLEGLVRRQADLQNRLSEAQRQRAERERAGEEAESALVALGKKLADEEQELESRHQALGEAQRAVTDIERTQSVGQQSLGLARSTQTAAENERREVLRKLEAVTSQLAAVAGEQQASLYGGVRAVVTAAEEGRLGGYVGTVAELVRVPSELEVAIEAALGGRLQEVVVEAWADAERAIAVLKGAGAGRATFLPLDTVRSQPRQSAPRGEGVVGVARDLVEYEPRLQTMAEALLGRLLIVEDLAAARKTLAGMPANAPWTLATLGGEVVRPGGSVTGGSNTRADDARARGKTILARERKRRELGAALEKASAEAADKEQALERAVRHVREQEGELESAARQAEAARKHQVAAQMAYLEEQNGVARLHQEVAWRNGLLAETNMTIEALGATLREISQQVEELARLVEPKRATVAECAARVAKIEEEQERAAQSTGAGQTRLAVLAESLRNLQARENELRREMARTAGTLTDNEKALAESVHDENQLARRLEEQAVEVAQLASQLATMEEEIAGSERQIRVLESGVSKIEEEQAVLQSALLESETAHSRAAVERQRCVGALESLRVEIIEEIGGGPVEGTEAAASYEDGRDERWLRWPLDEGDVGNDDADRAEEGTGIEHGEVERRIYAMKARLSRLGPVNPLAMEEHAALAERHSYLETQLGDLVTAAESLRRVIAELDRTMRDQFAATFDQVNEAFQHFFNRLFGGGTARLELTNPMDVSASGVEILAQPPGKRMQPLAALSGGERALTSAALLFALLRVRPVPFCVLDEVDAALDESNVTRFRSALQELGQRTQFVVITHNRGTIEAADTLYGISMAGDGTSQMLSLKVEAA